MPGDTKKKSPKHVNVAFGVLVERFMTNKSIYVTYLTAKRVVTRDFPYGMVWGVRCVRYANMAFSFSGITVRSAKLFTK